MVELRGRLVVLAAPGLAAVHGDCDAAVVGGNHATRIQGVDPEAVVIAVRDFDFVEAAASVRRLVEINVHEIDRVRILWVGGDVHVIPGPLLDVAAWIDALPLGAAVVRAVESAFVGLDQGVDAVRIRGHRHADAAVGALRKAVVFQLLPGRASIAGAVETAAGATAGQRPRRAAGFPERGEEDIGIVRVEGDVDGPGVFVLIKYFLPGLAAIHGAKYATFLVRAKRMAERCDVRDIRVFRMDEHASDGTGVLEADIFPGFASVDRFVDAVAMGNISADTGLSSAHVNHIRIGRRDGDTANGRGLLVVKDGLPSHGAIRGFPDPAAGRAKIVSVGIARNSGSGERASTAEGSDLAVLQAFQKIVELGRLALRGLCRSLSIGRLRILASFRSGRLRSLLRQHRRGQDESNSEESDQESPEFALGCYVAHERDSPAEQFFATDHASPLPRSCAKNVLGLRLRLVGPGETAAHNALNDQVVGGAGDADSDTEVELPVRRKIQIDGGEELLLLVVEAIEIRDRSQSSVVFQPECDLLGKVVADFGIGREGPALVVTRAVQRPVNGWVEGQIPGSELLVDDGANLPSPGIGRKTSPLIADFRG